MKLKEKVQLLGKSYAIYWTFYFKKNELASQSPTVAAFILLSFMYFLNLHKVQDLP